MEPVLVYMEYPEVAPDKPWHCGRCGADLRSVGGYLEFSTKKNARRRQICKACAVQALAAAVNKGEMDGLPANFPD